MFIQNPENIVNASNKLHIFKNKQNSIQQRSIAFNWSVIRHLDKSVKIPTECVIRFQSKQYTKTRPK